ncbi:hypothetical protein HPB47_006141 [Ixodes persulcatus]|uniref:Uncharacterized protein n=1 Tax=Ixodes persulcatus TaxID=34615 RepID=A0AC60PB46_IXOPE|nr:hypothetical protein HPB47_006141 [Ixodes persulcatus]
MYLAEVGGLEGHVEVFYIDASRSETGRTAFAKPATNKNYDDACMAGKVTPPNGSTIHRPRSKLPKWECAGHEQTQETAIHDLPDTLRPRFFLVWTHPNTTVNAEPKLIYASLITSFDPTGSRATVTVTFSASLSSRATQDWHDSSYNIAATAHQADRACFWKACRGDVSELVASVAPLSMSEVVVIEARSSSKKKRSVVWKFFDRSCAASSKCLMCGALLKTPTNTTTPLLSHLQRYLGVRKEYESATSTAEQRNTLKFKEASMMPVFKPRLSSQSVRTRSLTKKIGCFIATGLHNHTVVEEPAFLELMKCAVPEYNVPSRTTFSRTVVPEMYDAARYALHTLLHRVLRKGLGCIAITTDGWTPRAGDSYVSVKCHVLSEDFVPYSFVLACRCVRERHTAENQRSLIEGVFEEWGIPPAVQGQDCKILPRAQLAK